MLGRDQISASGRVSLRDFFQALPEQGNSGANAQGNNGNDGSIYVSLRSLGANRTLVPRQRRRMVGGGFMQDPTPAGRPGAQVDAPYDGNLYNTNPANHLITPSRRVQLFAPGDVTLGSEAREAPHVDRTSSQSLAPMPLVNSASRRRRPRRLAGRVGRSAPGLDLGRPLRLFEVRIRQPLDRSLRSAVDNGQVPF